MSIADEMKEANGLLSQILKQDVSGEMLRELVNQLATSGSQVDASLDQPHTAEEQDALQHLAEAIRLGDAAVQRLWTKAHNRPVLL